MRKMTNRIGGGRGMLLLAFMAALSAVADTPDALTFETEGNAILSTSASNPTDVFTGVDLADYEPAYIYFAPGSSSGSKYFVCQDLHNEILRPYFVTRATENDAATMTVQYQGVTRTHRTPYTASITIKFLQSGSDVKAYVVRAASLKPLDIELGLDLNAMVDGGDPRAMARPLSSSGREEFNTSVIAMRKPGAAVSYTVHDGDSIGGTLAGNGAVTVTHAAADVVENTGYLPNGSWVVVAENRDLEDLDEVVGTYHYGANLLLRQTAYNLKYTIVSSRMGQKTCQFQRSFDGGGGVQGVLVQFRQNGANVEAYTSQYRTYYCRWVDTPGHDDEIVVGMDFERIGTSSDSVPWLRIYNTFATSDEAITHGVKDLTLKFRSRATAIYDGFMPNANDSGLNFWTVIATNHQLSDLVGVDAFYHRNATTGGGVSGENLNISGSSGNVQFQWAESSFMACIALYLRQTGNNIEGRTGRYNNYYMYYVQNGVSYSNEVFYGTDFLKYDGSTLPKREVYGNYGDSDSHTGRGIKNLRLRFATGGVTYAAASTAKYGNDLTFSGSADAPLAASTVASTTFPSNGVITVNPYATLTLAEHTTTPVWTQYRVMTNGTLKLKGNARLARTDQIDLVGGTLSIREDEPTATGTGCYVNYVTLMNGARITGKPIFFLHDSLQANWIVAGESPSYCESDMVVTAGGNDNSRTFAFNVKDVAEGSDFFASGNMVDYGTRNNSSEYWNVHIIKDGAGTMEVSGDIKLPNEISVNAGALRLADTCTFSVSRKRSTENGDGSESVAEIWLAGGALETALGATNTIGKVVAKTAEAPLDLGDGSKLTLAGIDFDAGASLLVSDNLGRDATLRIEGLTSAQRLRIRCGADRLRVREDANGNLRPYTAGAYIVFR